MKNGISIGGVAMLLVVASGISNVMMIQRMTEVEQKVNSFTPNKTEIIVPDDIQKRIIKRLGIDNKSGMNNVSVKLDNIEASQKRNVGNITDKLDRIEKSSAICIDTLDKKIKGIETMQLQTKVKAAKSFEMAKQLKQQGNIEDAKTYALNAINHEKDNSELLKFYADIIVNSSQCDINELNQLQAVLDVSLFNVSAENISEIITIRNQVIQKKEQLASKIIVPGINILDEIKTVHEGEYALSNIVKANNVNEELLQKRIEKINTLLGENITDEQRAKLTKDLQYSSNIYTANLTIKSVINALNKAKIHANESTLSANQTLTARNQLSTGNTLLGQIWTLELPQSIVAQAEKIQEDISSVDEKLNKLASKEAMKKHNILAEKLKEIDAIITSKEAKDFVKEVDKKRAEKEYKKDGTLTKYLSDIQKYAAELRKLKIFYKEGQDEAVKTFEETQKLALKVSAKRYQAYQLWAIKKIEAARKDREDVSAVKPYTNRRAIRIFKDYLMDIDRSLLTYDTGTCYDKVYYLIFQEQVPDSKKAELQYEKATFDKLGKLEDF